MEISTLIEFKNWADEIYLDYIGQLTDEQYHASIPGHQGSIEKIFRHMVIVYWDWYVILTSQSHTPEPDFDNFTRSDLATMMRDYNKAFLDYLEEQDPSMEITLQFRKEDKPVITTAENILFNYVTHSAYHRGQIALYLKYLGFGEIKETDFNPYIYQLGQR